jgi:hypothetical protein
MQGLQLHLQNLCRDGGPETLLLLFPNLSERTTPMGYRNPEAKPRIETLVTVAALVILAVVTVGTGLSRAVHWLLP